MLAYISFPLQESSVQLVAQLCPTLCDPMDCTTPGFPVHQLPGLAQIHVHRVSDAIQSSAQLYLQLPFVYLPGAPLSQIKLP